MSASVPLSPLEATLENQADHLLAAVPPDPDCVCYSEGQLATRYRRVVSIHALDDSLLSPPTVAQGDELRFLAGVSRLSPLQRLFVELWADGWSAREIATKAGHPAWRVARSLRSALRRCYDAAPVSFRAFSHHTIYRPPSHVRRPTIGRRCIGCGETYLAQTGCGRYCNPACREQARGERAATLQNRGLTTRPQSGMMLVTITTGRAQHNRLIPLPGLF